MTLPHSRFLNDASTHSESVNENYKMIDIWLKVVKIISSLAFAFNYTIVWMAILSNDLANLQVCWCQEYPNL